MQAYKIKNRKRFKPVNCFETSLQKLIDNFASILLSAKVVWGIRSASTYTEVYFKWQTTTARATKAYA